MISYINYHGLDHDLDPYLAVCASLLNVAYSFDDSFITPLMISTIYDYFNQQDILSVPIVRYSAIYSLPGETGEHSNPTKAKSETFTVN